MMLWPLTRPARSRSRPDPADPAYPAFILLSSPVLLLAEPPEDAAVQRLVHEWNPRAALPEAAAGVRWAGPFRLDAALAAQAALPPGWSTAYAAQAARSRTRVPDGLDADLQRLRYPQGLPSGAEAVAWSLIMGLARRLDGAGRLPADSPRATRVMPAQRALAQENSYCVYAKQALPWSSLRSVLCLSLPELDRNGAAAKDDYCLDRPSAFEVRVQPFRRTGHVPYALRARVAAGEHFGDAVAHNGGPDDHPDGGLGSSLSSSLGGWPSTVYRFRCLPQQTERAAQQVDIQLRAAACQLADVVDGGVLLDGDGFPLVGAEAAARR